MANFSLLKIKKLDETEIDTAIKSDSANGLVKTRMPYTKIRKKFTLTITSASTQEEFDELYALWTAVRTITPFVFDHPTEKGSGGFPKQYTVRFESPIVYGQDADVANYYSIEPIVLVEV